MSAISLSHPIFIFKINSKATMFWNGVDSSEKDYYIRFMGNKLTDKDDRSDQLIIDIKKFEQWKKDPGFK